MVPNQTNNDRKLKRVTLEMSLKPFKSMERASIEAVCAEAIRQWLPLIGMAKSCSMLLWIADGSEILTWDGNLQTEIEWARYIGFANEEYFSHIQDKSSPKIAIPYISEPSRITYGDLKFIVEAFKRIAHEQFGILMEVGATFDAGPEFAYSDFKYTLHPEINRADLGGQYIALKADYTVVCSWSKLKEDHVPYAGYPEGIPEGTPFGQFLGRQCASFLPTLSFDYIWFSNGFALSYFPWTYLGANYNGTELPLADYKELSSKVMSFWDLFKAECPAYRTEIRGTNFGTGMDLAKDFIPFLDLYEKKYVEYPPPNSPWGALNYDFGLEMTGYMSRIAVLPGEVYPYRYYPNDPWFWQNPWWDLYDREPHDIYLPLSAARVNTDGELEHPQIVEILTIDTELGELNEDCPMEIIPHMKRAFKDFPDQPGLLTWVYPFRELHAAVAESNESSKDAFFHDWFVRNAINEGLPLNTVISTDDLFAMSLENRSKLADTVLFMAASWVTGEKAKWVANYIGQGGKVILYGAVQDPVLQNLLNVKHIDGLEGDFVLKLDLQEDQLIHSLEGDCGEARLLRHQAHIAGGKLSEIVANPADPFTSIRSSVQQHGEERVFALTRAESNWQGGTVSWIRGSLPFQNAGITHLPVRQEQAYMDTSVLVRYMLTDFGYTLRQSKLEEASPSVLTFVTRHDNGFMFNGCKQDTSVILQLRFPDGVPVITGQTAMIGEGTANYALERTFHDECRIFVDQQKQSRVWCRENSPYPTSKKRTARAITLHGLHDATVTFYPPFHALQSELVEVKQGEEFLDLTDQRLANKIILTNISGTIEISW
jgi:hypothetical protein